MSTLQKWLSQIEQSNSQIKLGLDNINQAVEVLKLKKPAPYVITVAGTNGKGSVCRLLEKIFTAHGLKIGCYTSPHLVDFNERICIDTNPVTDQEIIASFEYIDQKLAVENLNLTFFEFTTIAAWSIFANNDLDIVILEIGLGGRLDAVNAIPKDLAIITSIDYDHQQLLGDTLELIGAEKAGIISEGISVILGSEQMPESVLSIARSKTSLAQIYQYQKDFNLEFKLNENANIKPNNIATALMAVKLVLSMPESSNAAFDTLFDSAIVQNILLNFNIIGRCSWLDSKKTLLCDVAHNPQSINNLASFLQDFKKSNQNKKIIGLCGMLGDKDIDGSLTKMAAIIDQWNLITIDHPRGAKAETLAEILTKHSAKLGFKIYNDIHSSCELVYNFIKQEVNNDCILVIFGSFYIVGPIYKYITTLKGSQ